MKKQGKTKKFKKTRNKISSLVYKFRSLSLLKHILVFYLLITVVGSLLLFMPISQQSGAHASYIDSLFTSASAFSDTGLATVTTATTWSVFGQAVIAILILLGGIGWFAIKIYFFNILIGRPISFRSRETLAAERGSSKLGNTRSIVKISVTILFSLIIIATFTLTLYFYFVQPDLDPYNEGVNAPKGMLETNPYHNLYESFRFGLFHSISALNNAGFDIIGGSSLAPYYHKYGLQIIFIVLFVIGGLGYPVLHDIWRWIKSKFTKEPFKWSLFTKISMIAYTTIVVIGLSMAFALEVPKSDGFWANNSFIDVNSNQVHVDYGTKGDRTMALIFNTMSTRNAGFATINMHHVSKGTLTLFSIMMFIGSAPSSTAGGIRTTTMAIVVMGLWSRIRGRSSVRAFNRKINPETVSRAYIVTTTAVFIVVIGTIVAMTSWSGYGGSASESEYGFSSLFFEVSSAFGTTGLSTGITPELSTATKLILVLIMFIGQLGVSSTLLVWDNKKNKSRKYKLVQEDITIG